MQYGGRVQFIQSRNKRVLLRIDYENPQTNIFDTRYDNSSYIYKFYQVLKNIRLPTQLSIMNYDHVNPNEVKKVSINIINSGKEMINEMDETKALQQDYEVILRKFGEDDKAMQELLQLILKDYSLVHKCYNLPIPVYSVEEKPSEESIPVSIFGTRGSRRNSSNFRNLYGFVISFH